MNDIHKEIFSQEVLNRIFPQKRTEDFFGALLGDSRDGAYDIVLSHTGSSKSQLEFEFQLKARTGKCLKCSLTHGLPDVFLKHPIIDIKNIVKEVCSNINVKPKSWKLGTTTQIHEELHVVPITIELC